MNGILFKIIPVILILILGYVLKRLNILKKEDGDLFLKLVFYIAAPALIVLSIAKINLQTSFVFLPLAAAVIVFVISFIAFMVGKWLKLSKATFGTFLIGSTIMNIGFALPFFIAAYGDEGLARVSLFDFGNGLLTFTFVYFLACKYGTNSGDKRAMAKKLLVSPPIWALLIGLGLNLTQLSLPVLAGSFLQLVGGLTVPLIMLALGVYFSPKIVNAAPVFLAAFIRMICGLAVGFIVVRLFQLEGLNRLIVLIGAAAPVGYNTLTFSSLENLDREFAASLISFSIFVGIIFLPALIYIFS